MLLVGHATHLNLRPVDGYVDIGGYEIGYRIGLGESDADARARATAEFLAAPDDTAALAPSS